MWEANLAAIKALLLRSNARHGANVSVSAVLLDSERFTVARGNATWNDAMTAKHDMMYNASKRAFPSAPVEFYDRGGYTMDGIGTAYFAPSPYYTLEERGDSFATSLYGVGELGYTREQYDQTVALALAHSAECNKSPAELAADKAQAERHRWFFKPSSDADEDVPYQPLLPPQPERRGMLYERKL